MSRPQSPARAHYERASAEQMQASTQPATRADATAYELMLAKLTEDKRRLHELQSIERRIDVKRTLLPEYEPWVEGALKGAQGVQDDVLMTVMVWRVDVGDLAGALAIADYAIQHKLAMPDQYKRSTGCLIAEEFADYALRLKDGIDVEVARALYMADQITRTEDMPDEVRAKLYKAMGYGIRANAANVDDKKLAVDLFKRALSMHEKVGVKKDIEALEREIKNLATPPAGDSGAGGG